MSSKYIPNSFQMANAIIDDFLDVMSPLAFKCYALIVRKTRGWQKESDSIAQSQFMKCCNIKKSETVQAALDELLELGLIGKIQHAGKPCEFFLIDEPTPPNGGTPKNGDTTQNRGTPTPPNRGTPPPRNGGHINTKKHKENNNLLPPSVADEIHDCANALVAADATTGGGDSELECFVDEASIPKNRREFGTNPRALGTNPRALGINPRAKGTNPRALGNVPTQQVLQTYNDVLGNRLPKAQMLNDKRKRVIAQRWREMLNSQDPSGKVRFTDTASGLAWFGKFFAKVALNPHWLGENDRGWRADLDWILKPDNFVKILEWRPK